MEDARGGHGLASGSGKSARHEASPSVIFCSGVKRVYVTAFLPALFDVVFSMLACDLHLYQLFF